MEPPLLSSRGSSTDPASQAIGVGAILPLAGRAAPPQGCSANLGAVGQPSEAFREGGQTHMSDSSPNLEGAWYPTADSQDTEEVKGDYTELRRIAQLLTE